MALSTPLLVAAIAGVALVASVSVDLAFDRIVRIEARGADGAFARVGEGSFDGDPYARPAPPSDVAVDPNGTLELRYTLVNEFPWPTSATLYVSAFGCYDGATRGAEVRIRAPGGGEASATASVRVEDLRSDAFTKADPMFASAETLGLTVCSGDRYVAQVTLDLEDPR